MPDATAEMQRASADIPLTRDSRDILERASGLAAARGSGHTTPVDVLQATMRSPGSLAVHTIRGLGLDPAALAASVGPDGSTAALPLRQLLVNANREAQVLGHYQVDSIHLMLALLYSDSPATAVPLRSAGLTLYDLRRQLQTGGAATAPSGRSAPDAGLRRRPLPSLRGVLTISPIFLAIVAATAAAGILLWFDVLPGFMGPLTIAFVTAGWITSLCIHEFGHAVVAYLGGDRAIAASGYLTLDPLRYTNLLLSLVMPIVFLLLGGIGLPGGAVYVNRSALRSRAWDSAVSIAGPAGTVLCGALAAAPFVVPGHEDWMVAHVGFFAALAFLGFVEAVAMVLNLLPVPGLDGFGILRPWLPYSVQDAANRFGMMAIMGVFIVLWYVAPVSQAFFGLVVHITTWAGIDPFLIAYGHANMRLL